MPTSQLHTFLRYTRPLWLNGALLLLMILPTVAGVMLDEDHERLAGVLPFVIASSLVLPIGLFLNIKSLRKVYRQNELLLIVSYAITTLLFAGGIIVYLLEVYQVKHM